ncbi:MAG: RNA 2',3'-cyclic phosphodiesterase [Candidatus Muiribacterium halophilum]|uniref:RNA 2',3'-cyclic phosphodiesterase n=1 Tax=Muiribacterium halophilum TaxID=2053465 RepID=A0A2N5Z9P8_MUIH1|nr:MAG: RNA 2',3'-cyclic phosphodiesterase [Candidatus Muirbacterium halophilum]
MRIFSAYSLSEKTKEELCKIISELKKNFPDLRWVKKNNLHLTIKFYGDTTDIKTAKEQTLHLNKELGSFSFKINRLSHFNEKIVFADCILPNISYRKIRDINNTFKPHITLARVKKYTPTTQISGLIKVLSNINLDINEHNLKAFLFESKLSNTGPIYKKISKL